MEQVFFDFGRDGDPSTNLLVKKLLRLSRTRLILTVRFELAWLQTLAHMGYSIISNKNLGSVSKNTHKIKLNLKMAREVRSTPTFKFHTKNC